MIKGPGLVIITGCTSGLGPILSQELLLRRGSVIITGRGGEKGKKILDQVLDDVSNELEYRRSRFTDDTGYETECLPEHLDGITMHVDITDDKDVQTLTTFVKENTDPNDRVTLVNNAAVGGKKWNPETFKKCMDNNVWGTINVTQKMLKVMPKGSRVYHMLCREARPRPRSGVLIPNEFLNELHSARSPDHLSSILHKRSEYFEHPDLLSTPHTPYIYSKVCQYAYAKMSAMSEPDYFINGICPGPMNTRICMYKDCYRDPFDATAVSWQALHWDDLKRNKLCLSYWLYNTEFPRGYLFSTTNAMSMEDHCDPNAPSSYMRSAPVRSLQTDIAENWRHRNLPTGRLAMATSYLKSLIPSFSSA